MPPTESSNKPSNSSVYHLENRGPSNFSFWCSETLSTISTFFAVWLQMIQLVVKIIVLPRCRRHWCNPGCYPLWQTVSPECRHLHNNNKTNSRQWKGVRTIMQSRHTCFESKTSCYNPKSKQRKSTPDGLNDQFITTHFCKYTSLWSFSLSFLHLFTTSRPFFSNGPITKQPTDYCWPYIQCCWSASTMCLHLVSWCFEPSQPHRVTSGLNVFKYTEIIRPVIFVCRLFVAEIKPTDK